MAQQTGRVTVKFDNEPLRSKPGASIQIGGIQRTGDVTDQGEYYYAEKHTKAVVKCTMPHMADTDLLKLRAFKNGTVSFETDTGLVFTVANAVTAELGDLSNGEIDVTFEGSAVK